jgi:16S rRNA A1518/A1519 N6-dimethyltransferase RsmA/KsgA/DIM1 with predicted DNA glycosylase/AP lyase activity
MSLAWNEEAKNKYKLNGFHKLFKTVFKERRKQIRGHIGVFVII